MHKCKMFNLWNRLVNVPEHRLTRKIFNWEISKVSPWANEMKSLFSICDISVIFSIVDCDVIFKK